VEVLGPTKDYQSPQTNAYLIYEPYPGVVKKGDRERLEILSKVLSGGPKIVTLTDKTMELLIDDYLSYN
jgi:hypothetical protein